MCDSLFLKNDHGILTINAYIYVKNLDYKKTVTIHYTTNSFDWFDKDAVFKHSCNQFHHDMDRFDFMIEFNLNEKNIEHFRFAIKYQVGEGKATYWNNNQGKDFIIS